MAEASVQLRRKHDSKDIPHDSHTVQINATEVTFKQCFCCFCYQGRHRELITLGLAMPLAMAKAMADCVGEVMCYQFPTAPEHSI